MMKRRLILFVLATFFFAYLPAQSLTGVSTSPENKKAIMEEFTGVRCGFCPDGHTILQQIDANYPGNVFFMSFHPGNSSLTAPYAGDPDLTRTYPESFYSTPYCGSSRFMPSSFINRRIWSGDRLQGRGSWDGYVQQLIAESSPLNVGILAEYNPTSMMLDITVEVYYTSTMTEPNTLYVILGEDAIVVQQQSGASGAYTQNHVFREAMTAQWGDNVMPTTMGSMVTFTYQYDNSTSQYDMNEASVMAYVENKTSGEIESGMGKSVTVPTVAVATENELSMEVFPNPFSGSTALEFGLSSTEAVTYAIYDIAGKEMLVRDLGTMTASQHRVEINASDAGLQSGVYFLRLNAGSQHAVKKLVLH